MSEEEKLEFISNIKYYWNEKGDIERYRDFSIDKLKEASTVLADAYERYKSATDTLHRLLSYDEEY